jgi:pimeloyl-ACP methyl ester carboxylesterase
MMFMASNCYRAIAHDRRGRRRSSQPRTGNNMDTNADDLAQLIDTLNLRDVILVGHFTGGGDVTHYVGRQPPQLALRAFAHQCGGVARVNSPRRRWADVLRRCALGQAR